MVTPHDVHGCINHLIDALLLFAMKGGFMSLIVAARFTTFPAAEDAAQRLFNSGFVEEDVTLFFVNPSGQHARYPIGGDTGTDAEAREAPKGAGKGVAIGAALGAVVGVGIFTFLGRRCSSRLSLPGWVRMSVHWSAPCLTREQAVGADSTRLSLGRCGIPAFL